MPLLLPNLDTRRWSDLVDEGRALVPRYAPAWTDHNVHDPGITIIELFAFAAEQLMYRANRIPERHRRKFLELVGFAPRGPAAARCAVAWELSVGASIAMPAGVELLLTRRADELSWRTITDVTLVPLAITAIVIDDGRTVVDRTRALVGALPFAPFGTDPGLPRDDGRPRAPSVTFTLSGDAVGASEVAIYFAFAGGRSSDTERQRIIAEAQATAAECTPSSVSCPPTRSCCVWCNTLDDHGHAHGEPTVGAPAVPTHDDDVLSHHAVRTRWEYLTDADTWSAFPASVPAMDGTRAFTLDGFVRFEFPANAKAAPSVPGGPIAYQIRCVLQRGRYDAAPIINRVATNVVIVEQVAHPDGELPPAPGADPQDAPDPALQPIQIGTGSGEPWQRVESSGAPIASGSLRLWTLEGARWRPWQQRRDFDASAGADRHFTLDEQSGTLRFGDGARGRTPPDGSWIVAAYDRTSAGAVSAEMRGAWHLVSSAVNQTLLGANPSAVEQRFSGCSALVPATGGADAEDVPAATARAIAALWSHERLLELASAGGNATLDQLPLGRVLALREPERAATVADHERIALEVPGTLIRRARAWADIDPAYPGMNVPGTVTVVILPELPVGRPTASRALLRRVQRYLDRRRTIGTRIRVVPATYIEIVVRATVKIRVGASAGRVSDDVKAALRAFLDPLSGGPSSMGWPFGRDVFRSELLQQVSMVAGVDYVETLNVAADGQVLTCENACVPETCLVVSGPHEIEAHA